VEEHDARVTGEIQTAVVPILAPWSDGGSWVA